MIILWVLPILSILSMVKYLKSCRQKHPRHLSIQFPYFPAICTISGNFGCANAHVWCTLDISQYLFFQRIQKRFPIACLYWWGMQCLLGLHTLNKVFSFSLLYCDQYHAIFCHNNISRVYSTSTDHQHWGTFQNQDFGREWGPQHLSCQIYHATCNLSIAYSPGLSFYSCLLTHGTRLWLVGIG